MSSFSKDEIKNRMLRRVATLWDVRNVEKLDPIVKLLIEALASEVFRLSNQSSDSGMRILEKVARVLTPSNLVSAQPAHAILTARSLSGTQILGAGAEFNYKNAAYLKKTGLNKLPFTAIGSPRIIDGAIRYMICGGKLMALDGSNIKDHLTGGRRRNPVFNNALWIGIETGPGIKSLKDLSIYFDFPYSDNREEYYVLLPHIKWSAAGRRLDARHGMYRESVYDPNPLSRYNLKNIVDAGILAKYNHRFITLNSELDVGRGSRSLYPQELEGSLEQSVIDALDKPLVWLKAEFPAYFTGDAIESATTCINAFPVANKYLSSNTRTLGFSSSIMPLNKASNEYFLGVESVYDSKGRDYTELQAHGNEESCTYSIRKGGCERYNSVDAREYLMRLIDMLRDESMAFAKMDKDTVESNSMVLLSQISTMEYKSGVKSDLEENTSYLIFDRLDEDSCNITATYWLSNGRISEEIRKGEHLESVGDADVLTESAVLLTAPKGGYEAPSEARQIETFKFALISHGAVYSKDDISSFVLSRYGDFIESVEVSRGYAIGNKPHEGIIRVIDVKLTPKQHLADESRSDLKEDILFNLIHHSPDHFNYRVICGEVRSEK